MSKDSIVVLTHIAWAAIVVSAHKVSGLGKMGDKLPLVSRAAIFWKNKKIPLTFPQNLI